LFTADFNAVLDRIEEPELLLKQAVREMEETIEAAEQRIKRLNLEREQCLARVAQATSTLAAVEDELDVCFAANEETLARTLIRRRLETERQLDATRQAGERVDAALAELEKELDDHRQRLERVRQQAGVVMTKSAAVDTAVTTAVTNDDVEVAFLREKQRRAGS
jgi:phage shock protein A